MKKNLTAIIFLALGCGPVTTAGIHNEYAKNQGISNPASSIDYVTRAEYLSDKGNYSLAIDDLDKARELSPDEKLLARINYLHAQCNYELAHWALIFREKSSMERKMILETNCSSGEENLHAIPSEYFTPEMLQLQDKLSGTCELGRYGRFNEP